MPEFIEVDPAELHLPPSRLQGADPGRINDGVTRATRAAKLCPGALVPIEVIEVIPRLDVARTPRVREVLP